ncbi:MAG: diphosphate--fructose-6-phosphate 1-phosphotransferase [Chloroflexota bacterium]
MAEPETLLVGQSGGPTPVINGSLAGLLTGAGKRFGRVLGLRHGIEGAMAGDVVDLSALTASDVEALRRTPAAALGSCRHKLAPGDTDVVLGTLRRHNVRAFAYIGGNDSMDTCAQLERAARDGGWPLAVYGVPKTIDNDLAGTDHCPGYGSAARYWAISTQEATRDLAAMRTYDRVLILECAGRNAGWLTASTALYRRDERDGPHLLLVPERPFERAAFLGAVERAVSRVGYCVVAVAETIRDADGAYVAQSVGGVDRFGHAIVTAAGETLAQLVARELGVKARANKPGTFQRTSMAHVSTVDREEAFAAGVAAAQRLAAGESGKMVAFVRRSDEPYVVDLDAVPLETVANRERRLPEEFLEAGEVVSGTGEPFRRYATPLLGPAPEPHFSLA